MKRSTERILTTRTGSLPRPASPVGRPPVDPDITWAKLAAMADGAQIASRELWGTATA